MFVFASSALAVSPTLLEQRLEDVSDLRAEHARGDVPSVPAALYETALTKGGVAIEIREVPGSRARQAIAVSVVDVPIEQFFAAVNDDQNRATYTALAMSEVLDGTPCATRTVYQHLDVPMFADRWWVVDVVRNEGLEHASRGRVQEQRWDSRTSAGLDFPDAVRKKTRQGSEIEFAHGSWFGIALDDDTTLVEYWTWSDPGGFVPGALVPAFIRSSVTDNYEAMTALAKAGASCAIPSRDGGGRIDVALKER